jgi:predicted nucleic acid-binding protein
MTITIDTSVFVETLLGQERAGESKELLDRIGEGNIEAVISRFALHATEAMIRSMKTLSEFLRDIKNSKGLKIYDTTLVEEASIVELIGKTKLDFDDCVQFYVARQTNSSAIVSFDKHFDSCGIRRSEPRDILKDFYQKEHGK